ncbi:DNA-binding transcriptional regulator, LysR family [Raineyella antarctica]|uniref:DNA-binding transcriptional regulator, LysR family n=1 Tax=Raineyella antarctica TaxID=1577474 RepID=A0A1G6GDV3_9ACTN|nr:LysR family transcriptional regulator [Raineyella antarctica]SDB80181.1 DNA-binding transcriptional regulator, LysR family [Raineyella antarctica]
MSHRWPAPGALELLVAVAEQGSVGAAARSLDIAQPNASRTLRQLERELRVVLLERTPQGSTLTPEGELVVTWARAVLGQAQTLLDGVALLRRERAARVAVAATPTIAEHLVPMWVAELRSTARARAPQWYRAGAEHGSASLDPADVEVDLAVAPSQEVARRVARGESALGFSEEPVRAAGLEVVTFGSEGLVVLVAPHHPWARREVPVTPAELARTPLVLPALDSSVRRALDHALAPYDPVPPRAERPTAAGVLAAVAAGASPGVLNSLDAAQAIRAARVSAVPTAGPGLSRPLQVVWPKGGRPSGVAGELVGIALAHARRHAAPGPVG